jgi:hypothetical protein
MRNRVSPILCALISMAAGAATSLAQTPVDGGWTYQGRLTSSGSPASGAHDLRFTLYANSTGTTQVGTPLTLTDVQVQEGLFTVKLDFGQQFAGSKRWLKVEVRPAGTGTYTALPLQEITSSPQSLFAQGPWNTGTHGVSYQGGTVGINGPATQAFWLTLHTGPSQYGLGHTDGTISLSTYIGSGGGWFGTTSDHPLHLFTNNSAARMTVTPGGNVGIGTTTPNSRLTVVSSSNLGLNTIHASATGNGVGVRGDSASWVGVVGTSAAAAGYGGYFINSAGGIALWADGQIQCKTLKILGGADLAEAFDVRGIHEHDEIIPGMVVVIDENGTGEMRLTDQAYDAKVAGVISGANGLSPGMVMKAEGVPGADGKHPVAMTGRVWCYVDAGFGAVRAGDRITTSPTPGHGMKADDAARAPGAVIGKAMSDLPEGKGLVLVLVNLQ